MSRTDKHTNREGESEETIWDVVVVGGGAAGMMAAGRAAECGAHVLVVEKNSTLGRKLLITGGGRCNVTNAEPDLRTFLAHYNTKERKNDRFLFSTFSHFGTRDTIEFFETRGVPTKIEALQRVFPESNTAQSVWDTLTRYMQKGNVTILSDSPVTGFVTNKKREEEEIQNIIQGIQVGRNDKKTEGKGEKIAEKMAEKVTEKIIRGRAFILATGGTSHPETGSSGDGFGWLRDIGHSVTEEAVALVPVRTEEAWVKRLAGVSLPDVKVTLFHNDVKQESRNGKILFTHTGLSGPTILNMSRDIRDLLPYGTVHISLDLLPHLDHAQTNTRLQEIFKEESNKKIKNTLSSLVPASLVPVVVELSGINPDTPVHSVSRLERITLISVLKNLRMKVTGLLGLDKAVVTSGGLSPSEVDWKTMASTRFPNLFVAGDILDIDRPTGGYSLQLCWTSGYVAGESAALWTQMKKESKKTR